MQLEKVLAMALCSQDLGLGGLGVIPKKVGHASFNKASGAGLGYCDLVVSLRS
jgi:hypothetical protein